MFLEKDQNFENLLTKEGPRQEPFLSYNHYLKSKFGGKTYKIVISSGLTCPTRDGSISKDGCAFCDVRGSSSFYGKKGRGADVTQQINSRIEPIRKRFGAEKFLAYFQSYTNTYSADIPYLREIYTAALSHPDISGLCIGTRPDCLSSDVLDLLNELSQAHSICLELGIQSFDDPTLEWLKRGHSAKVSIDALHTLKKVTPKIEVCAHLIFGNPTDQSDTAIRAAQILNEAQVSGVKLHQLMILKNTELSEWHQERPIGLPTLDEYAVIVGKFLSHLSPNIYIERLYATATHPEECLAPEWSKKRWEPHNTIRCYLESQNIRQGCSLALL